MLAFSVSAAMTGLTATSVVAQEADDAADNTEVIQVTGIRGALQRAQAIKMDQTSIVEALSAEDIGKLPDTSVAESLARLPGLAGERRNGRTSGLSVRGFNENYVGTSLNGRELLGMGDNRGVEYDLYPSEIVSSILVYKTPEAGLLTQGIGGTVDLQTVSPLSADPTLTVNFNYEENGEDSGNPDFDNNGHRLSLNFVEQFADDTLGVALAIADMESPRQEKQFRGWGYAGVNTGSDRRATDSVAVPDGTVVLGGHDSFTRSAMLERTSVAAVIEYAPNDDLKVQLDALFIDFEENDARRGVEEGGAEWGTGDYNVTSVDNGLVTSGFYDGFYSVVRNDVRQQSSELTTFGLNIEYALNDNWSIVADLSTGEVDKELTDVESYSGVGRAGVDGRPITPRSWTMTSTGVLYSDHPTLPGVDLTDPSLITLAGPQAWGAPIIGSDAQDGFVNAPVFDEELDAFRFEVNGLVEWGIFNKFTAGINYADRSKTKINKGFYLTAPEYPGEGAIPEVLGVADLSFIGISGVLAYDSLGLYNSGYYTSTDAEPVDAGRLGDTYTVNEELTTLYAKLDIDTEIGDMMLRGNIGVQIIDAEQSSSGFSTFTGDDGLIDAVPVTGGDSYADVLPTLNLSLEVAEDQYVRLGASKIQSRPRMDQMKPNNQASFQFNDANIASTDIPNGPWSGNVGNPGLKPLEANQFDLAYENYFADDAYFAMSFFYKELTNWHAAVKEVADFTEVYVPGYHADSAGNAPAIFLGLVDNTLDGREGFVRGWEFQTSLPFNHIHDALDGFGMFASATFMDGELDPFTYSPLAGVEVTLPSEGVPGLSDETYSLTLYYENAGWEVRVSGTKRDAFQTETRGISLSLVGAEGQGGEQWDAQIGYDFSESDIDFLHGLRVTLQGQNLTDEDEIQFANGDPRQVTLYQSYGRNFLLGLNYSFW
ncbi:TonB-dependent receptor [Planctobacterium marinum]|uniref:TonB-dependent receptor n=2 Tax=Planctobacterium marinum TaxID=1631968 RepID=A0AA48HKE3_9ALTE|nr:TonB-dependent receptor [Planctobacterium marinum]